MRQDGYDYQSRADQAVSIAESVFMEGMYGGSKSMADSPPSDAELLAGLRAGNDASFEILVRLWCGPMLLVARRFLHSEEDARDAVQDAFIQVFRNVKNFEGRSSLSTWLHRIVTNSALSILRKRSRMQKELSAELLPQFDETDHRVGKQVRSVKSVDELLTRAETCDFVRRQIAQLPDQYRIVLLLRDIDGYDTSEAAKMLDISEPALKVRLHRARHALKKLIEPLLGGEMI